MFGSRLTAKSAWPDAGATSASSDHGAGFGPSVSSAPVFTLHCRLQGQFQLDLLPPGPHERAALLTLVHRSGLRRQADYYALY